MTTYQTRTTETGAELIVKDGTIWIPKDPANTDYQVFLEWVAAGNTPTEWSPE